MLWTGKAQVVRRIIRLWFWTHSDPTYRPSSAHSQGKMRNYLYADGHVTMENVASVKALYNNNAAIGAPYDPLTSN